MTDRGNIFNFYNSRDARSLQRVKSILILLLIYGLVKMKFTVWVRLDIYIFLENHELQLGVRSSQVSMRVFLNRFLIWFLLYYWKQTNLKTDSYTDDVPKYRQKYLQFL